ncbi:hypothetical protein GE061_016225 [Apolygus lucorum]|uniref:BTB domain-containing protein n=1 Tax=Apolygus lucorum TaxID=248454 RepID=A0A8S9XFL9_APOLU|nr:hypothetical protein GE061_016225 [Apolygus lucorum]
MYIIYSPWNDIRRASTCPHFLHEITYLPKRKMMHIRPTRGLKGPSYVCATFDSSSLNNDLANTAIYTLKSKLSKNRIHSTNSRETVDDVSNNKIPISLLVTRILQINPEVQSQKPGTQSTTQGAKIESTSTIAVREEHPKPDINWSPKVAAVASSPTVTKPGKAGVLFVSRSSTALRTMPNGWSRTTPTPQPPKTAGQVDFQHNSTYKETYEKLRKLGLLKSRMGNCHVGMTSPSGKTKYQPNNVKTTIEEKTVKKLNSIPKKPTVIKSKFLDNDVVLKVQHYYVSQGKEVPEELKIYLSKSLFISYVDRTEVSQCLRPTGPSLCLKLLPSKQLECGTVQNHASQRITPISNDLGKTVLHTAASCGRTKLCEWLITKAEANASIPDLESGYTPLHSALFYGHVDVAVKLIELGAKLSVLDREHLSPISLLSLDTSSVSPLSPSCTEAYVCGSNLNYTLGVGTNDPKKTPEVLEFFRRNALSIKEICMEEFHTVFVTNCHQVYVCGHGQGGRLGIGKEKPLLIPTQLPTRGESCIHAAVGLNHTLFLLSNGGVLSCGSNLHHQLGISPYAENSSSPRYVNINASRPFGVITTICASRYHSVFSTSKAIFACGLNAGQLGSRDNHMDFFTVPQQLAAVGRETDLITHVTTSLGSVSYATSSGDIFTFHQFQCKKIMRCPDILKLESQGGHLAPVVNGIESGEDLKIVWLTKRGMVFIWHEKRGISKCSIVAGRSLSIYDICLRNDTLFMVTKCGEAFYGLMKTRETGVVLEKVTKSSEIPCWCNISVKQFANMHRALSITSDPKGKNIAFIQAHPSNPVGVRKTDARTSSIASHMKSFLELASEHDGLHDILFLVNGTKIAAHKFILASRGCPASLLQKSSVQVPSGISPVIFEELLKFVYTGDSALLHLGKCGERFLEVADPVKKLAEAAIFAGVEELQKRLQNLRFENGVIYCLKELKGLTPSSRICFDRQLFPALYDVDVVCEDSVSLKAHKCILAARMEYFNNMFMRGWTEAKDGRKIHLQCSSRIVNWILDFLYTDRLPESLGCDDLDNIIKLLIASDQYLIDDLKDECSIYLSELLSLKNCVMILQLANTYNEHSLQVSVMEYIAYNLNAVIENRYLELLDDSLLSELKDYCRDLLAVKFKDRAICTYFDAPADEDIVEAALDISFTDSPMEFPMIVDEENEIRKLGAIAKKKTPKKMFAASPPSQVFSPSESDRTIQMSTSVESGFSPSSSSFDSSFKTYEFPLLSESFSAKAELAKSPPKQSFEPRRVYPPKLSQKLRKKLSSEFEEKLNLNQDEVKPKRGWAKIEPPPETHLELSRSPVTETAKQIQESGPKLVEIIAREQQKRTNLRKMTTKPFHLTQMEDSAMLDLQEFYNAGCSFDERITITRVVPLNIAEPTWMPLSRRLPVL